ncbi:MAG: helix-turn-helix domain-containing protein [Acidobacteriaceae bacterium]
MEEQEAQPAALSLVPLQASVDNGSLQVAQAVRDLRRMRNLSQRQLAGRMNVPRTYISKIENGKATPTLSSMQRLATALQVEVSTLLRDARSRQQDELAMMLDNPFLAEIAGFVSKMDSLQRSILLNHVRELAAGRRRTA